MIGTIHDHTVAWNTRTFVPTLRATVVRNEDPPEPCTSVITRPRWVRASGGRRRSTTVAAASTATVTPTSTATVRHETRRPLKAISANPITGTSVRIPPT